MAGEIKYLIRNHNDTALCCNSPLGVLFDGLGHAHYPMMTWTEGGREAVEGAKPAILNIC